MEENTKSMEVLAANNVRAIVSQVNELKIQKEDIVSMFPTRDQIILIYYK